jgi:hypothetical protein
MLQETSGASMLAAHTASFLKLISSVLEDMSRGVASPHHFHNVRCGIENILSLLKHRLLKKRISSHAEPATTSHTTTWSHRKIVMRRLARMVTACAPFARRLPAFALRWSTASRTPGSARSDLLRKSNRSHGCHKAITHRSPRLLNWQH